MGEDLVRDLLEVTGVSLAHPLSFKPWVKHG